MLSLETISDEVLRSAEDLYLNPEHLLLTDASGQTKCWLYSALAKDFYDALITQYKPAVILQAVDFSCEWQERRFRGHLFHHIEGWSITLRALPNSLPTLAQLGMSQDLIMSAVRGFGLVLFCGPTGAGKSTTLGASAEQLVAEGLRGVMVTIEDPIEYIYTDPSCYQREVGVDLKSAADGIIEAMRQRPRTIIIGEIRHPKTGEAAVLAGLTGHRVLATLHAESIEEALSRMWGFLDPQYHELLRYALNGIIVQHLVRRPGAPPVAVYETIQIDRPTRSLLAQGPSSLSRLPHEIYRQKRHSIREHAQLLLKQGKLTGEEAEPWVGQVAAAKEDLNRRASDRGKQEELRKADTANTEQKPKPKPEQKKTERKVEPPVKAQLVTDDSERRKHPRYTLSGIKISLAKKRFFGGTGTFIECAVVDLSAGGLCVESDKTSYDIGEEVLILVVTKQTTIELTGDVRFIKGKRIHVRFTSVEAKAKAALASVGIP